MALVLQELSNTSHIFFIFFRINQLTILLIIRQLQFTFKKLSLFYKVDVGLERAGVYL